MTALSAPEEAMREALLLAKQWLELEEGRSLEEVLDLQRRFRERGSHGFNQQYVATCEAIVAALCLPERPAQQEAQPVAWLIEDSLLNERYTTDDEWEARNMGGADKCKVTPLYTRREET